MKNNTLQSIRITWDGKSQRYIVKLGNTILEFLQSDFDDIHSITNLYKIMEQYN